MGLSPIDGSSFRMTASRGRETAAGFLFFVLSLSASAVTIDGRGSFEFPSEPKFIVGGSPLDGVVLLKGLSGIESLIVEYAYSGGKPGTVRAETSAQDVGRYTFTVPSGAVQTPAALTYAVVAHHREPGKGEVRSETRTIPVALEKELDITGDAAVALLYPIGGPEYTVRYVPCCNIFGGTTIATRLTVNPEDNDNGLPEKRLSDFIVLEPDGLSASTMGLYFDFKLGAEQFNGVTPGLFEFDGKKWVEFKTYTTDPATGGISMHCPNGGTFVVAAKP